MSMQSTLFNSVAGAIAAALLCSACAAPLGGDYRLRFWEKFTWLGQRAVSNGDYAAGQRMLNEAVAQARCMGSDNVRLLSSLTDLGWAYLYGQQLQPAEEQFRQALSMADKLTGEKDADKVRVDLLKARCLTGFGDCYRAAGNLDDAKKYYEDALAIYKSMEQSGEVHIYDLDGRTQNDALSSLAQILLKEGRVQQALQLVSETKRWEWSADPLHKNAPPLVAYSRLLWLSGQESKAMECTHELWVASLRDGQDALKDNDLPAAEASFKDALQFATAVRNDCGIAESARYLATVYTKEGQPDKAVETASDALAKRAAAAESSVDFLQAVLERSLMEAYQAEGRETDAAVHRAKLQQILTAARNG